MRGVYNERGWFGYGSVRGNYGDNFCSVYSIEGFWDLYGLVSFCGNYFVEGFVFGFYFWESGYGVDNSVIIYGES